MSIEKAMGPESVQALKDWIKSYVASALNGGGYSGISSGIDIYEHQSDIAC